ncbi:MAG: IS66 family insertion sequence element accessory protein TnpB [Deltaproteobacteria bacterium]|nr:IS66 family insertion sequence element accessory protein TnpB [Deltaproteobacteria bacterium]
MLTLPPSVQIYLAAAPIDLRKGFDGLAAIVRNEWRRDVFSGHLFVFLGRRADRVKILFWDRNGYVLYVKRLERGRFRLPAIEAGQSTVTLEGGELTMLLDGLELRDIRRQPRWQPPPVTADNLS